MGTTEAVAPSGLDFTKGVSPTRVIEGKPLSGHVGGETVLLCRFGRTYSAVSAKCTHYGAPLNDGFVLGDTIRCPWHHACFSLRTGEALSAPAFDPLARWDVEERDGALFVRDRLSASPVDPSPAPASHPARIVIVGGGPAGFAAAEMLRRRDYRGTVVVLSADAAPPCDRPNLSKDYLAGTAPEGWIPLKPHDFYKERRIDLRLNVTVVAIDPDRRQVLTQSGERFDYDRLLLATGCEPVRLRGPGFGDTESVFVLRSLADARKIIAATATARSVAVIGASFIGLEVAAALRQRGLTVHVVAPEPLPMAKILGPELGAFVQHLHERNGVVFHLESSADSFSPGRLALKGGEVLEADIVVLGVGVRPRVDLAPAAGLKLDRGVVVDAFLETSHTGIFAAGDIARVPAAQAGETLRIEHWVTAERQGQVAALNMLGHRVPFRAVPFFWSNHFDVSIRYVGHTEAFDRHEVDGDVTNANATVRYFKSGRLVAAATIGRDRENLILESELDPIYRLPSTQHQQLVPVAADAYRPSLGLLLLDVAAD